MNDWKSPLRAGLLSPGEIVELARTANRCAAEAAKQSEIYVTKKPKVKEEETRRIRRQNKNSKAVDVPLDSGEEYKLRDALAANWVLKDALNAHAWNRDEADRCNNAIIAQKALRDMIREDEQAMRRHENAF